MLPALAASISCLLALPFLLIAGDAPRKPEAGSQAETRKDLAWAFTPDPALPNVLILGDSISIGYTLEVREQLRAKANVFRPMSTDGRKPENCSGTTAGVQRIDQWLAERKWAVIHFNWGLHDLKHVDAKGQPSDRAEDTVQATVEQYTSNLEVIVGKLKATGARLVFATTTPVVPGTGKPLRDPEAPARYNQAALAIMQRQGIAVDDLFVFCSPHLAEWQLPHNVHFTAAGSKALAGQVAGTIAAALAPAPGP